MQLRPDGKVIAIRRGSGAPFIQDYHLAISIAIYPEFGASAA